MGERAHLNPYFIRHKNNWELDYENNLFFQSFKGSP